MNALTAAHISQQSAAIRLREWQEGNIFTTIRKGDSVLIPVHDAQQHITEYLWFKVTSTINIRWITGYCLSTPESIVGMVNYGSALTFRKNKIMALDPSL